MNDNIAELLARYQTDSMCVCVVSLYNIKVTKGLVRLLGEKEKGKNSGLLNTLRKVFSDGG